MRFFFVLALLVSAGSLPAQQAVEAAARSMHLVVEVFAGDYVLAGALVEQVGPDSGSHHHPTDALAWLLHPRRATFFRSGDRLEIVRVTPAIVMAELFHGRRPVDVTRLYWVDPVESGPRGITLHVLRSTKSEVRSWVDELRAAAPLVRQVQLDLLAR